MRAVWRLAAPSLNSYEDPEQPQQILSVNYMDNCDGRAGDRLTLGPLVTDIDCDGADSAGAGSVGTAATTRSMVFSESMETTNYLVVARGTKLGIISTADRLLKADGTAEGAGVPYTEAVYDLLYTRQGVTDEISVFFEGIGYRVITAIAGASYTASENNETKIVAIGRRMGSDAAAGIVGMLGRSGNSSTALNTVYQNILSGSVTQDASSVTTIATLTGPDLRFTGMAMDGRYWILGTSDGPYYLEADGRRFRPLIEEIDNQLSSPTNCFGIRRSTYFGTVIPLERSTRVSNELQGASIGPEIYPRNDSPVRQRVGMGDGSELWDYWPIYNGTDTYICAVRPRRAEDYVVDEVPVVYYPIIKLSSAESKVVAYAGRRGAQTNRTVYFGNGSNVSWFLEGSTLRFPDDSNYTYASTGTVFGTELRRNPEKLKKIKRIGLSTNNCTSTETVAIDIVYRDQQYVERTVRCGSPITKNGWTWLTPATGITARTLYPKVTLARGGTTTLSPYVVNRGEVVIEYDEVDG